MKSKLTSLALASTLATSVVAGNLPSGRIETMVSKDYSTLDVKTSMNLFKDVNYFGRAITTYDHKTEKVTPFAFIDFSYSLGKGFGAVYETQFIDLGDRTLVQPRVGLEYFKELTKDFNVYGITTVNFTQNRDPDTTSETVVTLKYTPKLTEKLDLLAQVETVTNFGSDGLNFASQNFRLGIASKTLEGGLAVNLSQTKSDSNQTIGGFLAWKF